MFSVSEHWTRHDANIYPKLDMCPYPNDPVITGQKRLPKMIT